MPPLETPPPINANRPAIEEVSGPLRDVKSSTSFFQVRVDVSNSLNDIKILKCQYRHGFVEIAPCRLCTTGLEIHEDL